MVRAHTRVVLFCAVLTLLWGGWARRGSAEPVAAEHLSVELLALQQSAQPGKTLDVGLHFRLEDHWHIYWQNPGDSGQPTRVEWELPDGVEATTFQWPAPERQLISGLMNYGYSGEVLLPLKLSVPPDFAAERLEIKGLAKWLVCREECIPGEATLSLSLPVLPEPPETNATNEPLFVAAFAAHPTPWPADAALIEEAGETLHLILQDAGAFALKDARLAFVPEDDLIIANAAPQEVLWVGEDAVLRIQRHELLDGMPQVLRGVLLAEHESAESSHAFAIHAGPRPVALASRDSGGLLRAILFALIGGILLNLMPCVFPVLSIKVLGFVYQAGEARGVVRRHGLAYSAGVLVSFWVLAGLLLALRAGGEHLGWGFQLQSPGFIVTLSFVLFLLALSLSGVVELGTSLTGLGGVGTRLEGYAGSFATGVLATIVATPCTAPLMGAALGYALSMPAGHSLAVFTALGGGMALPYLLLSESPETLRRLPRPGPWMETFRQAMAFPLYGTVVWLISVLARQRGEGAAVDLLTGLLLAAVGLWTWSKVREHEGWPPAKLAGLALLAALCLWGGRIAMRSAQQTTPTKSGEAATLELWQPYSRARVAELTAAGTPVFVNFTAAWCITCVANERLVFSSEEVRATFSEGGVALLKADWTNRDEEIARTLESYGRSGVPLYVLHPGRPGATPQVLPPVLTRAQVIELIEGI